MVLMISGKAIYFEVGYSCWIILFAFLNKLWIKYQAPFRHWANGISHLSAALFAGFHFGLQFGIAILFLVRSIFDGFLSKFRGLRFGYVSPDPKSTIDQIEKRIFGKNGILPKLIYLVIAIILNIPWTFWKDLFV